jgi:hypothetical protein
MPATGKAANAAVLDAAKITAIKAAAATIVTNMATDVTNSAFAAARLKAAQLEVLYGQLTFNKAP